MERKYYGSEIMKRLLIILLFILLSVFPISAQFAGGSGTSGDPYQIATALQLDSVRNHLSSHYILTANIDLSEYSDWIPIGDNSNPLIYSHATHASPDYI